VTASLAAQRKAKMKTYTIDAENSITAFPSKQDAGEGESFSSQQELAGLVAEWPADRLIPERLRAYRRLLLSATELKEK
jgi:hypothetical protein